MARPRVRHCKDCQHCEISFIRSWYRGAHRSLILCFVTVFVLTATAFAEDTAVGFFDFTNSTYQTWKAENPDADDSTFTGFGGGRSDFTSGFGGGRDNYNAYVATVSETLGTSTIGDNCVYLGNWSQIMTSDFTDTTFSSGSTFTYTGIASGASRWMYARSTFIAPVSGVYAFKGYCTYSSLSPDFSPSAVNPVVTIFKTADNGQATIVSAENVTYSLTAGESYYCEFRVKFVSCQNYSCSLSGAVRMEYPAGGLATSAGSLDISPQTRAGSVTGDYSNGSGSVYENCTVFNETTNTFTDPATGTATAIASWEYDYATRTYSLYDADGNLISVAYQDQQLTITSGESVANYNYYVADSGGGSGGGSGSGSSTNPTWWQGIISSLVDGLRGLGELIGGIIVGICEAFVAALSGVVSAVGTLVTLLGEVGQAIALMWTWLPAPLPSLITATITVALFCALIRIFRG